MWCVGECGEVLDQKIDNAGGCVGWLKARISGDHGYVLPADGWSVCLGNDAAADWPNSTAPGAPALLRSETFSSSPCLASSASQPPSCSITSPPPSSSYQPRVPAALAPPSILRPFAVCLWPSPSSSRLPLRLTLLRHGAVRADTRPPQRDQDQPTSHHKPNRWSPNSPPSCAHLIVCAIRPSPPSWTMTLYINQADHLGSGEAARHPSS